MQHDYTPTEQATAAALERLADEHQRSAERAEAREEQTFFRRWSGAFRKALYVFAQGVRPEPTPSGAWLVPSATRAGQVHQVGRDGRCTCEAGQKGQACWHAALAAGLEIGLDDLDRFDDGPQEQDAAEPTTTITTTMPIGERSRQALIDAARGRLIALLVRERGRAQDGVIVQRTGWRE